jgi:carboxymethylenebutenolidase
LPIDARVSWLPIDAPASWWVWSAAMGEIIDFPSNGSPGQGYLAVPAAGSGPGVVVIQEWWGLVPHIRDVVDRFAAAGFVALAPDLYRGTQTVEPDEAAKEMMALQLDRAARDMSGSVDEVLRRSSAATVGVVGFCMGGGLALVLATQRPDAVAACVPFYGLIPWPEAQPDYSAMSAAVLGHVAGEDEYFSPEAAAALQAQLRALGKEAEFHVYEGAHHAFYNDTRPEVYDAAASSLAWDRTVEFLRTRLG